jgi:putative ABC transport system ATP-binding protein
MLLRVENLTKIYGTGRTAVKAVDNVSFNLSRGELILLMGPSGSGKTTLLTLVSGLLRPTSGTIYIDSISISNLTQKELAKIRMNKIGFIFQHFNLLSSLTALENVMVPFVIQGIKVSDARRRAKALLVEFGLEDRLDHKPKDLSGGEQQRVAVARAMVTNPDIIIADEPTANLDSKKGKDVMELIYKKVKEGRGALIASHDPRILDFADGILYMEDGKLREDNRT